MSWAVVLRPEVHADLLEAQDWYEKKEPGLVLDLMRAVEEMLKRIGEMPEIYAVVKSEVRKAKLRRFPYLMYYRLLSDRVEVIAILHVRRDSSVWEERV